MSDDPVNRPAHYTHGGIETIDVIEKWGLGFHLANVVKYISRAGKKDPARLLEDLRKARWYLDRYINKTEREAQATTVRGNPRDLIDALNALAARESQ